MEKETWAECEACGKWRSISAALAEVIAATPPPGDRHSSVLVLFSFYKTLEVLIAWTQRSRPPLQSIPSLLMTHLGAQAW